MLHSTFISALNLIFFATKFNQLIIAEKIIIITENSKAVDKYLLRYLNKGQRKLFLFKNEIQFTKYVQNLQYIILFPSTQGTELTTTEAPKIKKEIICFNFPNINFLAHTTLNRFYFKPFFLG